MIWVKRIITAALFFCLCNAPLLSLNGFAAAAITVYFIIYQILPVWEKKREAKPPVRLTVMLGGYELFVVSALLAAAELAFYIALALRPSILGEKQALVIVGNAAVTLIILLSRLQMVFSGSFSLQRGSDLCLAFY